MKQLVLPTLLFCLAVFMAWAGNAQQRKEATYIAAITEIKAKPETVKEVAGACAAIQQMAGQEPGCLEFVLSKKQDDPSTLVLFEIFRDAAALEAHRNQQHTKDFLDAIRGKLIANKVTFLSGLTINEKIKTEDNGNTQR